MILKVKDAVNIKCCFLVSLKSPQDMGTAGKSGGLWTAKSTLHLLSMMLSVNILYAGEQLCAACCSTSAALVLTSSVQAAAELVTLTC